MAQEAGTAEICEGAIELAGASLADLRVPWRAATPDSREPKPWSAIRRRPTYFSTSLARATTPALMSSWIGFGPT